jgi:alkanesulfonate monooxygenase SsuD/methylene tetrahydromethanopterin reductase-like flavin-dependent oxidoreductase (luciferase family)
MKLDIFYQLPCADSQDPSRRYRELIDEAVEADRLGFNTIWLAEVHFAPRFSLMPSPMLLLAAIAERTTRIRLGLAVNLVPLHHPIRLAEETAMLDVLSSGRVEFGAGRGAFPLNYRGFGVDLETSRELFAEGIDFCRQAWTNDRLTFRGKHFRVENINVIPKPVQKPHPPIRLAANSPDTFAFAGEHAYPIFAGGPVNPIPVLAERLAIYKDALAKAQVPPPDDWLAAALMMHPARDRVRARQALEPSLRNYFNAVLEIVEPQSLGSVHVAEFDKVRDRLRNIPYETVEEIMGIFGDPAFCIDKITQLRDRFGFSRLVNWFEIGGLVGHDNVISAMRTFVDKIAPHFT